MNGFKYDFELISELGLGIRLDDAVIDMRNFVPPISIIPQPQATRLGSRPDIRIPFMKRTIEEHYANARQNGLTRINHKCLIMVTIPPENRLKTPLKRM